MKETSKNQEEAKPRLMPGEAVGEGRVKAMIERVKGYAQVMEACIEEANRIAPGPIRPGLEPTPSEQKAREVHCRIALALFDRATKTDTELHLERYLDRVIDWYTGKDKAEAEIPTTLPPMPAIFTPRPNPTERLANIVLDFLESRFGAIFGEIREDRDEGANEEGSDAPGQ